MIVESIGLDEENAVTEAIWTKLFTIGGKTIKKPSSFAAAFPEINGMRMHLFGDFKMF